jgi:hypothetical protein
MLVTSVARELFNLHLLHLLCTNRAQHSTCKDNATTAHALQHWRYHLNQHIVDYLDESGYLTPRKIVQRDSHPTKKRRKEANKIVDEMENSGKIRSIYDDFRKEVNIAREAKSGWRGRDYSA